MTEVLSGHVQNFVVILSVAYNWVNIKTKFPLNLNYDTKIVKWPWTKWLPFCRQHFQMNCPKRKLQNFALDFTKVYSSVSSQGLTYPKFCSCLTSRIMNFLNLIVWNKGEILWSNPLARLMVLLAPCCRAMGYVKPCHFIISWISRHRMMHGSGTYGLAPMWLQAITWTHVDHKHQ